MIRVALVDGAFCLQARLYLMKEKRFAELLNGVAGPQVAVSGPGQAYAGGLLLLGLLCRIA